MAKPYREHAAEVRTAGELGSERQPPDPDRAPMLAIIESLSDAILVVDRAGDTVICNQRFMRMFETDGIKPIDTHGRVLALSELRERTARRESFEFAFRARDREGRERWLEVIGRPVPPELGIGEGGTLIVHDTTDVSLRRLQEEFVGIVAHELRTPLTALRGYLQMVERQGSGAGGVAQPVLGLAIGQADRLTRLVEELLDVTLAGRGGLSIEPTVLPLGPLVRETVEIAQGLADAQEFRIDEPEGELLVPADRARLQQVLLNLLTNALIHAPDSPDVVIRLRRLRGRAEIQVEDQGPGIEPDIQARLFSRFERGHSRGRGLGLGLYIAREIVKAHHGTIEVNSEPGKGTTFTIRLPLASTARRASARTSSSAHGAREKDTRDSRDDRSNGRTATARPIRTGPAARNSDSGGG